MAPHALRNRSQPVVKFHEGRYNGREILSSEERQTRGKTHSEGDYTGLFDDSVGEDVCLVAYDRVEDQHPIAHYGSIPYVGPHDLDIGPDLTVATNHRIGDNGVVAYLCALKESQKQQRSLCIGQAGKQRPWIWKWYLADDCVATERARASKFDSLFLVDVASHVLIRCAAHEVTIWHHRIGPSGTRVGSG